MADPLSIIALVATIGGTVVSTVGAISQANYQKQIAKHNAEINRMNAERARFRSQVEAQDFDREAKETLGDLEVAQAGSGLNIRSGSFKRTRRNLKTLARLDTMRIRQAGDVEAFNFLNQAAINDAQARQASSAGFFAAASGVFSLASGIAGSSLVGGAFNKRQATFGKRKTA